MILLFALLAAAPGDATADASQHVRDFQAASERALTGDLPGALTLYQHLVDTGVRHPDLYYNMGLAYAKAGQLVDAAIDFECALRLAPSDEDARVNLDAVRKKLRPAARGDKPAEPTGFADAIEPLVAPLPQDGFALALLLFDALAFGALILGRFARSQRAWSWVSGFAFAGMIACSAIVAGQEIVRRDSRAVVTASGDLKEGPHARFSASGDVYAGERVRIRSEDGEWIEVQNEAGHRGWMQQRDAVRF